MSHKTLMFGDINCLKFALKIAAFRSRTPKLEDHFSGTILWHKNGESLKLSMQRGEGGLNGKQKCRSYSLFLHVFMRCII